MLNVVMLVRERWPLTKQALSSLALNTQTDFTLTLVDDASTQETKELLADWVETVDVNAQLIRNEVGGCTGKARNQGVEAARKFGTDNLLYLSDNDVYFMPKWDQAILAAHKLWGSYVKVTGGGCHPFLQPNMTSSNGFSLPTKPDVRYQMTYRDAVSGYSWLIDWKTWDKYGPLDAHAQGVRQSEDWAMCQKIIKAGFRVGSILPEVVLHTGLRDTFGERPPGWELIERVQGVLYE
jgi:glycosyltransferase involved in cell wall biosynthesis